MYKEVGKSLGQLHKTSAGFTSKEISRPDWQDRLQWCQTVFEDYNVPACALNELRAVQSVLRTLPQTSKNYGLIHYDFEPDNLFYDDSNQSKCPIYFDDCLYHWNVMDLVKTIGSLYDVMDNECAEEAEQQLLDGYRSVYEIDNDLCKDFYKGFTIDELAEKYYLSVHTIRKIVYTK